ncbi:MAG: NAD(P)/FAD-dependent oxidoreductase [Candidatus Eisenbacteria bacterium]|nr:NAD(P)/FAD-dependent oxidoreductase [Candidatus Eisenbacteria bacterium]
MVTMRTVIVVGAGAAGLMAAGQAVGQGTRVLLIERMPQPGLKLSITGKGRCNLTNVGTVDDFTNHFGRNGRFLRPAFSSFLSAGLIRFVEALGVSTVTERGGRVFPVTQNAKDVTEKLIDWARAHGVSLMTNTRVQRILARGNAVAGVVANGQTHSANAVIIATGGASYPETGSSGDGYMLAQSLGHTVVPIRPALVPLETAGHIAQRLQGLSLRNVTVRLLINGKKRKEEFGEMLFTHFGISGPIILTLSRTVVDALRDKQEVFISIDLKPALDEKHLDARLVRDWKEFGKRQFKTLLEELLPKKLIPVFADLSGVPPDKCGHQITVAERKRVRMLLKDFQLKVTRHRHFAEAIITAGGVSTKEINPHTMESRLVRGLYFAGEVIDIDADTGGYNLQAAFSTGWVAGKSAGQENKQTFR